LVLVERPLYQSASHPFSLQAEGQDLPEPQLEGQEHPAPSETMASRQQQTLQ
jgi:hypothetical protein